MKITVLGTGGVGRTIANKLVELGHKVVMGTRDRETTLASNTNGKENSFITWHNQNKEVTVANFQDSASNADLIFNCTNGQGSLAALDQLGAVNLEGKVLIDVSNPLDFSNGMPPTLNPVNDDSQGEQIQRHFPKTHVVKTLNTMAATLMVDPASLEGAHNVFICGDDASSKIKVCELLQSFGWKESLIIDLGDISNARGTEMLLPIWLRLWNALGTAEFNFHIQMK